MRIKNKYQKNNILKIMLKITLLTLGGLALVNINLNFLINLSYGSIKNTTINQKLNNVSINNLDNSTINNPTNTNNIYEGNIIISNCSESELLRIAQSRYEAEDYQGAIEIYQLDVMQNNDIAMCNLGFLYANYCNYENEPDYEKVISCYDKSSDIQSYRNRLAFYIKYAGHVEENILVSYDDMYNILQYLLYVENDEITKNYVINCGNENDKNYNQDVFIYDYDFSIFYCYYNISEYYKGYNPPYIFNGIWVLQNVYHEETHMVFLYQLYRYKHMDELEKFIYVD